MKGEINFTVEETTKKDTSSQSEGRSGQFTKFIPKTCWDRVQFICTIFCFALLFTYIISFEGFKGSVHSRLTEINSSLKTHVFHMNGSDQDGMEILNLFLAQEYCIERNEGMECFNLSSLIATTDEMRLNITLLGQNVSLMEKQMGLIDGLKFNLNATLDAFQNLTENFNNRLSDIEQILKTPLEIYRSSKNSTGN